MDGRIYTREDELDDPHEELGRARRHRDQLDRDVTSHRVVNEPELMGALRRANERVAVLERELAELCAEQIAAAEGFTS